MKARNLAILISAAFLLSSVLVLASDDSSAEASITLTDGRGKTCKLYEPAQHIVSVGKGLTMTVIDLGYVDSIVVCDKYSNVTTDGRFKKLNDNVATGKTYAGGSLWSIPAMKNEIFDKADSEQGGTFDKEKDVVMITVGSASTTSTGINVLNLESELRSAGFRNVLIWFEITEYDEIVDFVRQVSLAMKGEVDGVVFDMEYVKDHIASELGDTKKRKAFYVTYSGGAFKVGNKGSLGTSLALAAGANVVTIDASKEPTYAANLTDLIGTYGTDTVVFADGSMASARLSELRDKVGNDVKIVVMDPLWNNFDPESKDGIWTFACALYPELFSGDVPTAPLADDPNYLGYSLAGFGVATVIGLAGTFYIRR